MIILLFLIWITAAACVVVSNIKIKCWLNLKTFTLASMGSIYLAPLSFGSDLVWMGDQGFLAIILFGFISVFFWYFIVVNGTFAKKCFRYEYEVTSSRYLPTWFLAILFYFYVFIVFEPIITIMIKQGLGGVLQYIFRDRVGDYLEDARTHNYMAAKLKEIISLVLWVGVVQFWNSKKFKQALIIYIIVFFDLLLYSHTRFVIVAHVVVFLFLIQEFYAPVKLRYLALVFAFALMFISIGNYIRTGQDRDILASSVSLEAVEQQFLRVGGGSVDSFYEIFSMINAGKVELDFFRQYYIYFPLALVPRVVWEDKPIVSYFWRATEIIEGKPPGEGRPVRTTTYLGEAFHEGGIAGIFLLIGVYFLLARLVFVLSNVNGFRVIAWVFVINSPMHFRGGLGSILVDVLFLILLLLVLRFFSLFGKRQQYIGRPIAHYF